MTSVAEAVSALTATFSGRLLEPGEVGYDEAQQPREHDPDPTETRLTGW